MINIAVCDDEPFMAEALEKKVHSFFKSENIEICLSQFTSGRSLLLCDKVFDIVFLDIQMSELDGMETAEILRGRGYKGILIFITVLEEMVFRSFEVQAFDYLVKPVKGEYFEKMMRRLLTHLKDDAEGTLLVRTGSEYTIVPFDEISYCEAMNRKILLHLNNENVIEYYDKIENLEKKLDRHFFRCHRSYLINLKYLRGCKQGTACLKNGEMIPVSRLRREELSAAIMRYMKEWRV